MSMARASARILLLILGMFLFLLMIAFGTGSYHTREIKMAYRQYFDFPSDATKAELERVKAEHRRKILLTEGALATTLVGTICLFRRLGRKRNTVT